MMLKKYFIALLIFISGVDALAQQEKATSRNWLSTALQKTYPDNHIAFPNLVKWQTEQRTQVLTAIAALSDSLKKKIIARADDALTYNWPSLPASLYLDYKNTGTRVNYENLQNERRRKLANLVIGELVSNDGKYIPQVVNGLWLTLEESTWVAPAHIVVQKEGADLPNVTTPYIDLHASRTGVTLAAIYNMLAPKLDAYSKVINGRIEYEMNRRIFDPYLEYDNFWWMGTKGNAVNNWNAFNNTNCMQAALLMLKPGDTLNRFTRKLLKSADQFINQYPEDGGCDEGPGYWDMAGGKIIRLFSLLNQASDGQLDWSNRELLHKMGTYTYKMQIADKYVVNFADAMATYTQSPESVYAYGRLFKDEKLKSYAAFLFEQKNKQIPTDDVVDFMETLKIYPLLAATTSNAPYPAVSLLPDLEVFTARSTPGSTSGLFFAAKGGNNNESHNHNDIGNFIVYADGKPLLIDAGVGTYTSKTFSNKRYELWNMQSQWHNCPSINGVEQQNGRNFAAKNFIYTATTATEQLTMDIAGAYPKSAAVKQWKRQFIFYPKKNKLQLTETYELSEYKKPSILNFLTAETIEQGKGLLYIGKSGYVLSYNPKDFEVKVDVKTMDDARIKNIWGKNLYRIQLIAKNTALSNRHTIEIFKK
ncbi:MAG: heparinase II/III family protein [Bacteroidota bacterium]